MQLQQADRMQLLEQKAAVPDEDVDYILQKDKDSINRIEEGMKNADPAIKAAAILEMAGIEKERTMAVLKDLLASGQDDEISLGFTVLGSIADIESLNIILKNVKEEYFSNEGIRPALKDSLASLLEKNSQKLTEKTKNTITSLLNRLGD
jgi:hypothetical protein